MIMRLNDKTYKAAIKTTMLGKDAAKSEYWHFKDDNTRLYIRFEEEVPIGGVQKAMSSVECDAEMKEEPAAGDGVGDNVNEDMQAPAQMAQQQIAMTTEDVANRQNVQVTQLQGEHVPEDPQAVTTTMINTCAVVDNAPYELQKTESAPALDEDIVTPVVPTETHYSWYYYERED